MAPAYPCTAAAFIGERWAVCASVCAYWHGARDRSYRAFPVGARMLPAHLVVAGETVGRASFTLLSDAGECRPRLVESQIFLDQLPYLSGQPSQAKRRENRSIPTLPPCSSHMEGVLHQLGDTVWLSLYARRFAKLHQNPRPKAWLTWRTCVVPWPTRRVRITHTFY